QLGATIVRVFTAYESAGPTPHALWQRTVAALREMCERAAPYGVTLAIQNHHDLAVHTAALLELLADIDRPNCKLGFDAWSPALRGEDLHAAAGLWRTWTGMRGRMWRGCASGGCGNPS